MNQQKFGELVQELLDRNSLLQKDLASYLNISETFLSLVLHEKRDLTSRVAKKCILYLVREGAIVETNYVNELIMLAGCEDFSPTDWRSWPLKDVAPSEAKAPQQVVLRQQELPANFFDAEATHRKYLECIVRWYQSLTLPVGSQKAFALQSVFQPLRLRREIFFAEDLPYGDRRALLDEPTRSEDDPRWAGAEYEAFSADAEGRQRLEPTIATDGSDALSRSPQHCIVVLGPPGCKSRLSSR